MSVERVEINEPIEGTQMTLEEQLEKQEAEGVTTSQEPSGQDPVEEDSAEVEQKQEEAEEQQPEWLPEKFKTPEELAKAYNELETARGKESSKENKEESTESEAEVSNVSKAIQEASDAFYSEGGMTEDTYKSLEEAGVPREFAEAYVKGQQASIEAEAAEIRDSVGGKENYDAMIEWASNTLPAQEIESFDEIVSGSSKNGASMAVKGLYARYLSEGGGSDVNIAKGGTSKAAIQPFQSNAQVVEAMNDRRYETDPAYRAEIERRLSVSTNI